MALRFVGTKKPRTTKQMFDARCMVPGCGNPAVHQWSSCANGNRYVAVCLNCDWAVNELLLAFMRIPHRASLMAAYRRRKA